jgi:hypothetical protein
MIGQQSELNFTLRVAAVAETVGHADVPIVETSKSAIGINITTRRSTVPLTDATHEPRLPLARHHAERDGTTNIVRGEQRQRNAFLIDGVSNDQDALGDIRGDYSPDAIGEFSALEPYAAEYGQASGASSTS